MLINASDTPETAFKKVNDELKSAIVNKHHKFRFFSLATVNNNIPHTRMVVMRSFYDDCTFELYTDQRAQKINHLSKNPNATALFWDPSKNVQVRMQCNATIHHQNERAKKVWQTIQGAAKKAYTQLVEPGLPIASPKDAHKWPNEKTDNHFAIIQCIPWQIRVLQLNKSEHLALVFQNNPISNKWEGNWIAP